LAATGFGRVSVRTAYNIEGNTLVATSRRTDFVKIAAERQIKAASVLVYAVTSDLAAWPRFVRGIEKIEFLTRGPVAVGSRFREKRIVFGRTIIEEFKVALIDPPHRLAFSGNSHGMRYVSTAEFLPRHKGTCLRYTFEATPLTFAARILSTAASAFAGSVRAQMQSDLADIEAEVTRRNKHRQRASDTSVDPSDRTSSPSI